VSSDPIVERLLALEHFGIKLGLSKIRTLLTVLGDPQNSFTSIHIAGTNGKGSVSAMVERALRAAGHRTGRYTSPHLSQIEERIAIDGQPVAPTVFRSTAKVVFSAVDRLRGNGQLETTPTFFEVTTAMAFEIFRQAAVKVAVVEVGLGGRFDATNVLTPTVAAITSIALDHERHLGNTLASIAFEKAGILKRNVPAVVGDIPQEARETIENVAHDEGVALVPGDLRIIDEARLVKGRATISATTPVRHYGSIELGLNGAHQVANAAVAIRVLELVDTAGVSVAADHIVTGLRDVEWPARLEWLSVDGGHVLLDAAHNPAGANALRAYLDAAGVAPLPMVLAVMADKDVRQMVSALAPCASMFVATTVASKRALTAEALAQTIAGVAPRVRVCAEPDADRAVNAALTEAERIAVAGSIFLVGPLRARLITRAPRPESAGRRRVPK
jgi:dihydrofolate synthase / folylpolyglutamate synthase